MYKFDIWGAAIGLLLLAALGLMLTLPFYAISSSVKDERVNLQKKTISATDLGKHKIRTVEHDGHLWVLYDGPQNQMLTHHPDCCKRKN